MSIGMPIPYVVGSSTEDGDRASQIYLQKSLCSCSQLWPLTGTEF